MNSLFEYLENLYNFRHFQELSKDKRNTVNFGLETVTYKALVIWAKLLSKFKSASSLVEFKSKIFGE